ncbi:amidohydrolase family protein [Pseudarthrobacter albicanus]|uniref:amidohydrolase family protein n=1 Tax=Pseudarthrobacter albicanus TaxID=2823873 RepID=UPI001FE907AE|nr:amidohydrolase family protein [Pseudarthrobacter albicanus]
MLVGNVDMLAGLDGQVPALLAEAITAMPLVDHHVHGCFTQPITRAEFEQSINEGSPDPIPDFMTQFDSQLGFAIRRWCAPMLGLAPHASADDYWAARSKLPPAELNRLLLGQTGVEHWIIDTGFSSAAISTPQTMALESGAPGAEILRLELLAETVARMTASAASFATDFQEALAAAVPAIVGFKTIAAYRCGFDIDWAEPSAQQIEKAAATWMAAPGGLRLQDPVIIAFIVHAAARYRLPIQFHVGLGDRDMDLHRSNPMLLLDLLRRPTVHNTAIMLLHCYPYHREAGYLAQAFNNVYFDVGLSLNYVGARSTDIVGESLELAPFAKQVYSSDAFGLPELHLLGSVLWRRSMAQVLGAWVQRGEWSEQDAVRVAGMIAAGNARRVYNI